MAGFEATLPELSEAEARGELAVIYGELKTFARVPFVALLYRHLATREGVLPWLWSGLRPVLASGAINDAAERVAEAAMLPTLKPISGPEWRSAGLNAADRSAIASVLDAYGRANPINLVIARLVRAILLGTPQPDQRPARDDGERPARKVRPNLAPLPPILPVSAIPADTSAALAALARYDRPASGALTPSLYRHLAHWPAYLAFLPPRLEPVYRLGAVEKAVARYREAAEAELPGLLADVLPRLALAHQPRGVAVAPLVETLDAFAGLIPEMVAVGRMLNAGLPAERI